MSNDVDELWQLNEQLEEAVEEKSTRTPAQRMRDKLRKRKERENARLQVQQRQKELEAAELQKKTQLHREQSGVCLFGELRPGVRCATPEEEMQVCFQMAPKIGPFPLPGETRGGFITRCYQQWLRWLPSQDLLDLEGFEPGEAEPLAVAAILVENFRAQHTSGYWDEVLPVDPRAAHLEAVCPTTDASTAE